MAKRDPQLPTKVSPAGVATVVSPGSRFVQFLPSSVRDQVQEIMVNRGDYSNAVEIAILQAMMVRILEQLESDNVPWDRLQRAIQSASKRGEDSIPIRDIQLIINGEYDMRMVQRELRSTISLLNDLRKGEVDMFKTFSDHIPRSDVAAILADVREILRQELAEPTYEGVRERILRRFARAEFSVSL